jgi:hypothetical protein
MQASSTAAQDFFLVLISVGISAFLSAAVWILVKVTRNDVRLDEHGTHLDNHEHRIHDLEHDHDQRHDDDDED